MEVSFTPPARRTSTGYPNLGIAYLVWFVGLGWIADGFRLPRLVNG